jgi:single-stranded-DNA-specific exonuclease
MLMAASLVCGVERSLSGRAWRWRRTAADGTDEGFKPDDLTDQLLLARGVIREELARHREPTIRGFTPDPSLFRDMDLAAARLADAVAAGEQVAIFGDYDVDGATSAALLIRLLRQLSLAPRPYIPDRLMEGYGPSGAALVKLAEQGASLIVTVDCGAQAFDALAEAKAAGVDVIVVDHHQCAATLPAAYAVVNPNRLDEGADAAAHGHLAAVGVCFLLGAALLRTLRARGFFAGRAEPRLIDLIDLVALGTVADVAQLKGLNRAFVAQGLKVMARRGNVGLAALIDAARLTRAPACADLGFALGPRINAAGRVGTSDLGVRLLTTDDPLEAAAIAAELDHHNEERRAIEALVLDAAEAAAARQDNRAIIVAAGAGWHPGVIGIVAGRLKEKMERPAFVIGIDAQGVGKGSARSISGVDLGAAVLAAKESGLLVSGGGHAMAAGLTVAADKIDALTDFLEERLAADVGRAREDRALAVDAALACGGICPEMCDALEAGGPYGAGWPAPRVVAGPARVIKADVVGNGHLRLLLAGEDGKSVKAVAFRMADTPLGVALRGAGTRKLWLAGRMKRDDYNGRVSAELHLDDAAFAD